MPTLLLSPRHSEDTRILWRAAVAAGWQVHRVHNWRLPSVPTDDLGIYGEPLLTRHIARQFRIKLEERALDWLPNVPIEFRKRDVRLAPHPCHPRNPWLKIPPPFPLRSHVQKQRAETADPR